MWSGAYNIIIPSDGDKIEEPFWTLLETFDPDYLYCYQKCGEDLYLSDPNRYDEILTGYAENAFRGSTYSDVAAAKADIDKHLRNQWLSQFEIKPKLQEEIKKRLAPFWFEGYAVDAGAVSAGSAPDFHLTALTTIIRNTEHPNIISIVEAPDNIPPLWFGAVTGRLSSDTIKSFEQLGIGHDRFAFRENNIDIERYFR